MDRNELTAFVDRVLANAEREFGPDAPTALLECYAREAALELWLTRSRVSVYGAELALREVRAEIGRRSSAVAGSTRRATPGRTKRAA